ncbi:MAG: precorrin-8X methylmutase [Chloroflexi bacterium]|nr:precorrin-8X methylmutase [Chloroflexota bacterium]
MPGEHIQTRSFEIVAGLLPGLDQAAPEWPIIRRIVHSTGDPAIAGSIRFHREAVHKGLEALWRGQPIVTDVKMVSVGISSSLTARLGCQVLCAIDDLAVQELARERNITRSAAAMVHLSSMTPGAVVAIGNAPTALFALLEGIENGRGAPALVVGTPVGFVGAAEAKARLIERRSIPYITIEGTRGGSAMAVAAVNALLRMAVDGLGTEVKQ